MPVGDDVRVAEDEVGDPKGDPLVYMYQLLEGSGVTILRARDQFSLIQWTALHGLSLTPCYTASRTWVP